MSLPTLTHDQLVPYITGARWFGGKGRRAELHGVTPLPWLDPSPATGQPSVRFEIAEIGYPDHPSSPAEHYLLGLSYREAAEPGLEHALAGRLQTSGAGHCDDHGPDSDPDVDLDADHGHYVYDAMRDPGACRVILTALLEARRLVDAGVEVGFELSAAQGLTADLEPAVFTGQQSNTSVMFGEVAMIKFFRRLELGRNLDIEVHDALNRAEVADVAGLFGWIEASWTPSGGDEPVRADLAMVVEKLADAEDGWGLALASMGASFADDAQALGSALSETHQALRAAFPTAALDGDEVAAIMDERLGRASAGATALQPYVEGLTTLFAHLGGARLDTQRVHGDFHLGQTLHTPTGWKIIDFEGEPVKTLAERAAPDSVFRDIAGMLRSFDYAAASVPGPDSAQWAADCRSAFLTGYAGHPLDPTDLAVLQAYEADKAVYEVVYEARNRPDWVSIPLAAVARLAGAPVGEQHSSTGGPDTDPALTQTQAEE